jgi:hypothetical protein
MGFLQFLARKNNVKVYSWEGDTLSEIKFVLEYFDEESVKILYALRQAPQLIENTSLTEATQKMALLLGPTGFPAKEYNIHSEPNSIEQLDNMLSRMVGRQISWVEFSTNITFDTKLKAHEFSTFQAIKDRVNVFRDNSAIAKVKSALENNERVMFLGGQLHFIPVMDFLRKQ